MAVEKDALIESWREGKNHNKKKASQFLRSENLKQIQDLDTLSQNLNQEVSNSIDCLNCANCCKTTVTVFKEADITRAAKAMEMSKKAFIKKYLIEDEGEYTTITTPCPFLLNDNKCKIYEVRPDACASFPHTGRYGFLKRIKAHENNYEICPITYHVVQRMMRRFNDQ
ncbi:MAG: YkgJ family cysteine cluster protein [Saprospiraceae bacterium]|nr:YkgJ family cysteine cluster protein [Saprospiraceae bacterium]